MEAIHPLSANPVMWHHRSNMTFPSIRRLCFILEIVNEEWGYDNAIYLTLLLSVFFNTSMVKIIILPFLKEPQYSFMLW